MWALWLPTFLWLFSTQQPVWRVYLRPDSLQPDRAWMEWYVEIPKEALPAPIPRKIEVQIRVYGKGKSPLREWFHRYPVTSSLPLVLHDTLPLPVDPHFTIRLRLVDPRLERVLKDTTFQRPGWSPHTSVVVGDPIPLSPEGRGNPRFPGDTITVEVWSRGRTYPFPVQWEIHHFGEWKVLDTLSLIHPRDTLHLRVPSDAGTLTLRLRPRDRKGRAGRVDILQWGWSHMSRETREDLRAFLSLFFPARSVQAFMNTPPERQDSAWHALWKQKDPLPSTPENEFFLQVQERLRYVQQHFREGSTPGYRTDRGKVYLQYGPPDGVERGELSTGGNYEIWIYRDLGRAFQFEDPYGLGVYELVREFPL